jgi:hypothetical protein
MASLEEQIKRARAQVDLARTGEKVVSIKKQQSAAAQADLTLA